MEKLTTAQKRDYDDMIERIKKRLEHKTLRDYMNSLYEDEKRRLWFIENKYPTLDNWIENDHFRDIHEWEYKLAHEQNATWGFYNSSTLRALQKKGYIQIIEDGGDRHDIIVIL